VGGWAGVVRGGGGGGGGRCFRALFSHSSVASG